MNAPSVYTVTWRYKNGATLSQPLALGPRETLPPDEVASRAAWAYRWSDYTPDDDYFATWATMVTVADPAGGVYTLTPEEQEAATKPVRTVAP